MAEAASSADQAGSSTERKAPSEDEALDLTNAIHGLHIGRKKLKIKRQKVPKPPPPLPETIKPYKICDTWFHPSKGLQYEVLLTEDDVKPRWVPCEVLRDCEAMTLAFHLENPHRPKPARRVKFDDSVRPAKIENSRHTETGEIEYYIRQTQEGEVYGVVTSEDKWKWVNPEFLSTWPDLLADYHRRYPLRIYRRLCDACVDADAGATFELSLHCRPGNEDSAGFFDGTMSDVLLTHQKYHVIRKEMEVLAKNANCITCGLLLRCFTHFEPDWKWAALTIRDESVLNAGIFTDEDVPKRIIELYTLPGQFSPWSTIRSRIRTEAAVKPFWTREDQVSYAKKAQVTRGSPVVAEGIAGTVSPTIDEAAYVKIEKWYNNCLANHPHCIVTGATGMTPARLINIEKAGKVFLWNVQGVMPSYTALSHCWGGSEESMTFSTNLKQHEEDIPWQSLRKTFQNAIVLTRRLGIHYIWIDSLCIIQDSMNNSDWQIESAKMGAIYHNASLVILASWGINGESGLFNKRQSTFEVHGEFNKQAYCVYARPVLDHSFWGLGSTDSINKKNPLISRAWCFQERFLAVRSIQFMRDELVWECSEGSSCECGVLRSYKSMFTTLQRPFRSYDNGQTSDYNVVLRETWLEVVQQYSWKKLTKPSDILPALSGLAAQVAVYLGDHYRAGLWETDIRSGRGLVWYSRAARNTRPHPRRGPSWSWCSVDGPVTFIPENTGESRTRVDVLDIQTEATLLNRFGQITRSFLRLRGPTLPAVVVKTNPGFPDDFPDRFHDDSGSASVFLELKDRASSSRRAILDDSNDASCLTRGQELALLLVVEDTYYTGIPQRRVLVLIRCKEGEDNVYRRVGVMRGSGEDDFGWDDAATAELIIV